MVYYCDTQCFGSCCQDIDRYLNLEIIKDKERLGKYVIYLSIDKIKYF